ncbi:MAG: relaxase/mobilization nuclease domain-containing protein [Cyclobacteriaceae bacterium]|nr:relaxase/mobilization nuclease domain-containing protein [Cyclobacteriaceae bacterium]
MVARVISGKDLRGALSYNEHKVKEGIAECLLASNFHGKPGQMNFHDKLIQFQYFTDKNKKVKTNTLHISLNFDIGEKIGKEKLCEIAVTYMDKIGFGDQPYLVYEHQDSAHPHLHIITTNVRKDGKRIDIHNIGRNQSEQARKEIGKEFNLVKAESKKKHQEEYLKPIDLKKAEYGKTETKRSISNIVNTITRNYKFTSLPELNAIFKQYNIIADRGKEGSKMHEKKGLLYSFADERGNRIGVPIKASSIYGKPTMAFLEKQFQLNKALRTPHKEKLKASIDSILKTHPTNAQTFRKSLNKSGVDMIARTNAEGRIYGITYIDHRTKCVFNGSDLGKPYTAKGILDRLSQIEQLQSFRPGYSEVKKEWEGKEFSQGKPDLQIEKLFNDLIQPEQQEFVSPETAMKLKKKKKRRKGLSP